MTPFFCHSMLQRMIYFKRIVYWTLCFSKQILSNTRSRQSMTTDSMSISSSHPPPHPPAAVAAAAAAARQQQCLLAALLSLHHPNIWQM
ncbi:hypothetical protein CEXT_662161 [Caerostris extrusa]|uniref:Uncharacterized protein n=1 Tax=Caerostris extrusa TaxID=172846 RepID=A0AAV4WP69_CAEEX|nr:hypothetical protein CEXT_662161 [Caerostris extrusa]